MPRFFSRNLSIQRVMAVGFIAVMFAVFATYGANREWNAQAPQGGPDVPACFPAPTCPPGGTKCENGMTIFCTHRIDAFTCECVEECMPTGVQCGGGDGGDGGDGGADAGNDGGDQGGNVGGGGSSANNSSGHSSFSQPSMASSHGSPMGGGSSSTASSAPVECQSDADCAQGPCNNLCELIDGVGCAMKCDNMNCINNRCVGGKKACDTSECQEPSDNSSASSSSRSSGTSSINSSGNSSARSSVLSLAASSARSSRTSSHISQLSCTARIGNAYGAIDSALSADGFPVISVLDHGVASVIKCGSASCTANNSTSVIYQPASYDSNWKVMPDISIAVPADGLPVVAFYANLQGNLRVVKCGNAACSSGNTTTIVDGSGIAYAGKGPSIAIGKDGLPVVSYAAAPGEYGFMAVKFLKCGNAACSTGNAISTVSTGAAYVVSTAVVVPPDGKPFVAFVQQSYIKGIKCGNASCSAGNIADGLGYSPNGADIVSMDVADDDLPVLSFYQGANFVPPEGQPERGAIAQKCNDAVCADRTTTLLESAGGVISPSIWVGPDGRPAISFTLWDPNERPLTTAFLRLARCGNGSCTSGNVVKIVDGSPGAAITTSVVVPADNLPFIAYADGMGYLKVGKCTNAACDFICTSISSSSSRRSSSSSSSRRSSSSRSTAASSQSSLLVCDDNTDCPSGQPCIGGTCRASSSSAGGSAQSSVITCDDNLDCPSGQPCINGTCRASSSGGSRSSAITCDDNLDCPSGLPCISGTCRGASSRPSVLPSACRGDECQRGGAEFCGEGGNVCVLDGELPCIRCINFGSSIPAFSASTGAAESSVGAFLAISSTPYSLVVAESNACASPLDCASDEQCINGLCTTLDVYCLSDLECAPTQQCVKERCVAIEDLCLTDNDCAAGERCIGEECLDRSELALLPSYCGNARVDLGETCDDASRNSLLPNALCRPDCTPGRCGDNVLDTPLELCDDGNIFDGDGCSSACREERTAADQSGTLPAQVIELPLIPGQQTAYLPGAPSVGYSAYPPATSDTGPAAIAIMAAGASAGYAWMKRRRHKR